MEVGQNAPPSVQLVPAKRYYGAPIGTSYDIRCYVADRSDEKLHRRSTVKMGIRLIHKTNLKLVMDAPENYTTVLNQKSTNGQTGASTATTSCGGDGVGSSKQNKSDRIDSFTKLKLSPKAFRFTGKLCRSKSEIEKGPNERYDIISEVSIFIFIYFFIKLIILFKQYQMEYIFSVLLFIVINEGMSIVSMY